MNNTIAEHKLAFVVPTKDRPVDLRMLLDSLKKQTLLPDQLIIVDGSEESIEYITKEYAELPIEYVRVFPPSLAKQRNAGMAQLNSEITLAGYLDDDVVLEGDAIENLMKYWSSKDETLGGVVFNIVNTGEPNWTGLKSFFGIDGKIPGKVLPSGCTTILGKQERDIEVDWLCGGATVWRRDIVDSYPYDEWFVGTGYLEDVEYSYRIGEKYKMALVASARLVHNSPPVRRDRYRLLGKWQIVNRMYFVRKFRHRGLSTGKAWR